MRWIIVASAAAFALGGCGVASVPAPNNVAGADSGPRVVGPPPQETAYTRGIIQRDEWRATHQGETQPVAGQEVMARAPCGLLMEDVPDGLALVFTVHEGESVEALRQRVRHIAASYNDRNPDARALTQDLMSRKKQVSARASEHNVPGGARLVLSTGERNEVGALRALMRWHASDLLPGISAEMGRRGPCPSLPKPVFG